MSNSNFYKHRTNGNAMIVVLSAMFAVILTAVIIVALYFIQKYKQQPQTVNTSNDLPMEYSAMIDELKGKKEALSDKEKTLDKQSGRIKQLEDELMITRKKLEVLKDETSQKITKMDDDEKKNLRKLAKVYSLMDPLEAAQIMTGLDDDTVVNILTRMKERQAAKVLEGFALKDEASKKRAALISERIRVLSLQSSGS